MRCHSACFIASCVLFIAVAFPAYAHSQQTQLNTIALSGSTGTSLGFGPNLNSDDSFTGFGLPELNASGQVAFGASETGSSRVFNGIWTNVGVSLKLTVNGVNLSPILNSSGSLGFYSSLTVGSTSGTGLWTTSTGVLAPIALAGSATFGPNLGPGVTFTGFNSSFYNFNMSFGAHGEAAFAAGVSGTGITSANSGGLWTNVDGALHAIARSGVDDLGPHLETGVTFNGIRNPVMSSAGNVVFDCFLAGPGIDSTNNNAIFSSTGGALTLIARSAPIGPGPNVEPGVQFSVFDDSQRFGINVKGEITFQSTLAGPGIDSSNSAGLWTNVGGTLHVLARKGSVGPGPNLGPGVYFTGQFEVNNMHPVLNANGNSAFLGFLTGTGIDGTNDTGIWTDVGGSLHLVARELSQDPGPLGLGSTTLGAPFINASGQIAFLGRYVDSPSGPSANPSLFLWTNGQLRTIAHVGDSIDVNPDPNVQDIRKISSIGFFDGNSATVGGSGGEDGRRLPLNDDGLLVFELSFTDGSSGIFTALAPVPEPSGLELGIIAFIALGLYRCRLPD